MATQTIAENTKITIDGKEYTTQTPISVNDGFEQRLDANGQIKTFNQAGQEVDEEGKVLKAKK